MKDRSPDRTPAVTIVATIGIAAIALVLLLLLLSFLLLSSIPLCGFINPSVNGIALNNYTHIH